MKIAVISDIHSNFHYLNVISSMISNIGVDKIIFLGDAVGYYDQPNEVLNWLKEKQAICVKGNHDKYLLKELDYDLSRESLYRINSQLPLISDKNIEYMKSWDDQCELSFNEKKFYISHSGLDDCEKYCRSVLDLNKEKLKPYDYYLFGHTHVPWQECYFGTTIINPGSVGQPRDYSGAPSFCVINLKDNVVSNYKPQVQFGDYQKKLSALGYDPLIINILSRTRV